MCHLQISCHQHELTLKQKMPTRPRDMCCNQIMVWSQFFCQNPISTDFWPLYGPFYSLLEVQGPSGPRLLAGGPSGLLTLSFAPFGRSGRVTHASLIGQCVCHWIVCQPLDSVLAVFSLHRNHVFQELGYIEYILNICQYIIQVCHQRRSVCFLFSQYCACSHQPSVGGCVSSPIRRWGEKKYQMCQNVE